MQSFVTYKEVCEMYKITRRTLARWKKEGLPEMKLGYNISRYDLEEVLEWVKKNKLQVQDRKQEQEKKQA